MRLWDYFAGREVWLRSPLTPRIAADRINDAAGSLAWLSRKHVLGGAWFGYVRINRRGSLFERRFEPVLAGRIVAVPAGSDLHLRYRAPNWIYLLVPVWYSMVAAFAIGIMSFGTQVVLTDAQKAIILAFASLVPILNLMFATRRSGEQLAELLAFLAEHAEAKPIAASDPLTAGGTAPA